MNDKMPELRKAFELAGLAEVKAVFRKRDLRGATHRDMVMGSGREVNGGGLYAILGRSGSARAASSPTPWGIIPTRPFRLPLQRNQTQPDIPSSRFGAH
jgi:hypothetical protein